MVRAPVHGENRVGAIDNHLCFSFFKIPDLDARGEGSTSNEILVGRVELDVGDHVLAKREDGF